MGWRALVLVGLLACGHVQLGPLPPNMTPREREDVFNRYRPVGQENRVRGGSVVEAKVLVLADGTEVEHAEDLVPILPPESAAGRAARRSATASTYRSWFRNLALLSIVGGIAALSTKNDALRYVGGVVLVGGTIGFMAGYYVASTIEDRAQIEAFHHYEEGLLQELELCVAGFGFVPCYSPDLDP